MNCPCCGKPMEEGVLDSRGPVRWTDSASGMAIPTSKHDVLLGKALGLMRPKAYLCRDCRRVVVEY